MQGYALFPGASPDDAPGIPQNMGNMGYVQPAPQQPLLGQYLQGPVAGSFVAGIEVLRTLKTPRDPTQRLSGTDINSQFLREVLSETASSKAPSPQLM